MDQKFMNGIIILAIIVVAGVLAIQYFPAPLAAENQAQLKFSNLTGFASLTEAQQALLAGSESNELTIYNQNFGVVKESSSFPLTAGTNELTLTNIPESIDASSLILNDLTDSKTSLMEQEYVYDTLSEERLMKEFLNETISIDVQIADGIKTYTGKLVASNGMNVLLETSAGVISFNRTQIVSTTYSSKAGIESAPVLKLKVKAASAGNHNLEFSYLADNLDWSADYVAELENDQLNLKGYVTVENNTAKDFKGVKLNVVAGEVNRVSSPIPYPPIYYGKGMDAVAESSPSSGGDGFSNKSFGEYRFYSLNSIIDLDRSSSKQIAFMESKNIPIQQEYKFDSSYGTGVSNSITFKNDAASGLGIQLPSGTVKVYEDSANSSLQFSGEDSIENKTIDDEIELSVGKTFDITAEKTQTDYQSFGNCQQYSYSVNLNNQKSTAVTVNVIEHAYGESQVLKSSVPAEKEDAYTYKFPVQVNSGSQSTLTYTIQTCYR